MQKQTTIKRAAEVIANYFTLVTKGVSSSEAILTISGSFTKRHIYTLVHMYNTNIYFKNHIDKYLNNTQNDTKKRKHRGSAR